MNTQTSFDAPGTDLITPAQIDDLCAGRSAAVEHWLCAYDAFHEHTGAAAKASTAGAVALNVPMGNRYEDESLARAFIAKGETEERNESGRMEKRPARDVFARLIREAIDRRAWSELLRITNGEALMDRQAKEDWHKALKDSPPEFTPENCASTFGHLWENRGELFLRGIANTFSALDRRFRSHDGFKVGARLIIDRALNDWGSWNDYNRERTFQDVERLFYELDGKAAPGPAKTVVHLVSDARRHQSTPYVVQGDYFRVRIFGNGNLHIWFEREDLLRQVNLLLAEYYGEAIGDGYNETEADNAPGYHVTPAKRFGAFNTSADIAAKVAGYAEVWKGARVLEPSAGSGELAKAARERGAMVQCVEIQPGLAHELRAVHGFHGAREADFLTLTPADLGQFDIVLMNPPFDRGRDCDHVRHAWQFVKPGGRLVAIMSARAEFGDDARHKALHKLIDGAESCYGWQKWHDLPAGSFAHAGTNVNTACLTLRKRN
jgi:predicted RNA methylase